MTAHSQEELDRIWQEAEELRKATPAVKRNLSGGPLDGKQIIIPEDQKTNDVGWWTMHYELQPEGFMKWVSKVGGAAPG